MRPEILRFDNFELDLARYELRRGDRVIKLEKNPMELLILLVANPGRLVTREQIIHRLWGEEVFVDTRHGINTAIHKLRAALRDDAEDPRILETVVGKGYRLVAPVSPKPNPLGASLNGAIPPASSIDTQSKSPLSDEVGVEAGSRRASWKMGLAVTACLFVTLLLVTPALRPRILGRSKAIESLAVLPFENLSGDSSQDYFADGFTDELTTELAEQTRMRVVSRTSAMHYKGSRQALPVIARELKVDVVVEGSIVLSGQQARVTAQLIQTSNDEHLWAHTYQGRQQDLLSIQNQVAAAIAGFIRVRAENSRSALSGSIPARPRFTPETYELFLACNGLGSGNTDEGVKREIQCYQRILATDPDCATVHAHIAFGYLSLGMDNPPKARSAATEGNRFGSLTG